MQQLNQLENKEQKNKILLQKISVENLLIKLRVFTTSVHFYGELHKLSFYSLFKFFYPSFTAELVLLYYRLRMSCSVI